MELCSFLSSRGKMSYLSSGEGPVLVVVHGFGCNVEGYHRDVRSALGEKKARIVSPLFSKEMFPTNEDFQCGNVYRHREGGFVDDETRWTFAMIPQIVLEACPDAKSYVIYGHSAGGQFTHRFCYFEGLLRSRHPEYPAMERALIANPGWYTMPDVSIAFPYGLKGTPLAHDQELLAEFLRLPKCLLLGLADTDTLDPNLRQTPEAMAQGPHRLARGRRYAEQVQELQQALGTEKGLNVVFIEAGHSNAKMALVAVEHAWERLEQG